MTYWYPKMFGRVMNEPLGKVHFWLTFIFYNMTFFPMHIIGMGGQMRRIYDPTIYDFLKPQQPLNVFISLSAFALFAVQILFAINFLWSLKFGKKAPQNPWDDNGLEWSLPNPAPHGNWERTPNVYRGPYEFSSPEAGSADFLPQNLKLPTDRDPVPGAGVYSNKLGMWVFLASDVMFFTALIGSYIVLRFGVTEPWAKPGAVLNVPLTAVNTFLLICSSVSMVKAYAAIADGKKYFLRAVPGKLLRDGGLKFWLLVTMMCGAAFVGVQLVEYIKLVGHGFTPAGFREGSLLAEHAVADPVKYGAAAAGMYGSTFFTMTGFHGSHVTCGVISMTYLYFTKVLPEKYSPQDYRGIEVIGLYWHFVDLVWIILFTIVYLI